MSVTRWMKVIGLLAAAVAAAAAGRGPGPLQRLFPWSAEVTADGPGLCRLELGPEVLSRCRPDLGDLRVFDAGGRELPYLVDGEDRPQTELVHRLAAQVLEAERSSTEEEPRRYRERYALQAPPPPDGEGGWALVLGSSQRQLIRRLDVWERLPGGELRPVVEAGSVFRLSSPPAERMRVDVGAPTGEVVVQLEGQGDGFLEPLFAFESSRSLAGAEPAVVELEVVRVEEEPQRTVLEVARPRGLLPARLRLQTRTGSFNRSLTVWDDGPGAQAAAIGAGRVFRIDALVPVEGSEVALGPPTGNRLRVVIEDLDSPPLKEVRLWAVVPRPALYFSLPEGTATGLLCFGGGRARRPTYDLVGLGLADGAYPSGAAADAVLAFRDPSRSRRATLGPVGSNPAYDGSPALAFAMRPGAALDARPYSHRRRLVVEPSAEGLARLRLQPEDLAVARPDVADVRVVDGEGRQWAFLIEGAAASTQVPLATTRGPRAGGRSAYRMVPAVSPVAVDEIVMSPAAGFFDRAYRLRGTAPGGDPVALGAGRLVRPQDDPRPLRLAAGGRRLTELELEVEDGDDAPLELAGASAATSLPDLYLVAPAGEYTLLVGYPAAETPRYELERVRTTVLAVPSAAITAGGLEPSPLYRGSARLAGAEGTAKVVLWIALAAAVAVLSWLTLRLARPGSGARAEE